MNFSTQLEDFLSGSHYERMLTRKACPSVPLFAIQITVHICIYRMLNYVLQLTIQLEYAYNQILSVSTNTQLQQIFEENPWFDLGLLLQGSEKFVDNILNMTDTDPSLIFAGVSCILYV